MTDFSPAVVEQRVQAAIRPQLRDLKGLESSHKRAARIERLRRRYDMWDAHDTAVEAYATGQAFRGVYDDVLKPAVQTLWDAFRPIAEVVTETAKATVRGLADNEQPEPLPASDHAGLW